MTVGPREALDVAAQVLVGLEWSHEPVSGPFQVQTSAHGRPMPAELVDHDGDVVLRWREPQRRVAPGQSVVLYLDDVVVGGGVAGPALATTP